MHRTICSATLISLFALAGGCEMSYFAADVQASEVCVTGMSLGFPGVPAELGQNEVATTLETAVGEDDLGIQLSDDLKLDLSVVSVQLAALQGVSDLRFIDQLAVAVGANESEIPSTVIAELSASNQMNNGALYAEPDSAVDVTAHIRAGELVMDFALAGELPENDWQTEVDLCMSAGASYVAPL